MYSNDCIRQHLKFAVANVLPLIAILGKRSAQTDFVHGGTEGEYVGLGQILVFTEAQELHGHVTAVALLHLTTGADLANEAEVLRARKKE